MTFNELEALIGLQDVELPQGVFDRVTEDSRKVQPGTVFVAMQGEHADGHDFVTQAKQSGAVAIMGGRGGLSELDGLPYICVPHPRRALGLVAHRLAGDPTKTLIVIGVTGTNGKSSTIWLIRSLLQHAGIQTASFGTLGNFIGEHQTPAPHTTPFAEDLAELFRRAADTGDTHAVMEVSSHALEQERVAGIDFDAAVFTNLTQDHLDYHEDMDAYLAEKRKLFEAIEGPERFTVVNADDPYAEAFAGASQVPCYRYGSSGDCVARDLSITSDESRFRVESRWGQADVSMRMLGAHNVSNALAALTTCAALGVPMDTLAQGLALAPGVPGRFERVEAGQDFEVIVDYAHTEDGLRNVLRAAREIVSGRIITVFGCGGDRDRTKRPKMAAAVAELGDFAVITSDNPRSESPERILLDIEVGMQHAGKRRDKDYTVVLDRKEAVQQALDAARPGDLVMIAGKGHEDYQILNTGRIHFDDREVARELLEAR